MRGKAGVFCQRAKEKGGMCACGVDPHGYVIADIMMPGYSISFGVQYTLSSNPG